MFSIIIIISHYGGPPALCYIIDYTSRCVRVVLAQGPP